MKNIVVGAAAAALGLMFAAGTVHAGTLTGASVSLSNNAPSSPTNVTFTYTLESSLTDGDFLLRQTNSGGGFVFDAATTCTGVAIEVNSTPLAGTPMFCGSSTTTYNLRLGSGQTIPAGSVVRIVLTGRATTSATPGTYTVSTLRTADEFGFAYDTPPVPPPQYTIQAAQPVLVPTMTEWAMILFGTILAGGAALYIQRRQMIA